MVKGSAQAMGLFTYDIILDQIPDPVVEDDHHYPSILSTSGKAASMNSRAEGGEQLARASTPTTSSPAGRASTPNSTARARSGATLASLTGSSGGGGGGRVGSHASAAAEGPAAAGDEAHGGRGGEDDDVEMWTAYEHEWSQNPDLLLTWGLNQGFKTLFELAFEVRCGWGW